MSFLSDLFNRFFGKKLEVTKMSDYSKDFSASALIIKPPEKTPDKTHEVSFIAKEGLLDLCLKVTGTFEGGDPATHGFDNITGNSDEQGLSLGVLQQCLGQGSVQPMLNKMLADHRDVLLSLWGKDAVDEFSTIMKSSKASQILWGDRISDPENKDNIKDPWNVRLKKMLVSPEYVKLQINAAESAFATAINYCISFGLKSCKGVALLFDIVTQNGSISDEHRKKINSLKIEKEKLTGRNLTEPEFLECIAIGRASFSRKRYQPDVASRKLCIARGKTRPFIWDGKSYDGKVHEDSFDLEKNLGLDDSLWHE